MVVNLICRLFDLIAPLIRLTGADYTQFRAILRTKLLLDSRRHSMGHTRRGKKERNRFVAALIFHVFMGTFIAFILPVGASAFTSLTVIHTFIMVMIGMSLIADFTGVLMDTTDASVLDPRPITPRTALVARLAHIVTYLGLLASALSVAALIGGTAVFGVTFLPIFAVTLVLDVVMIVFAVNLFYLGALRLTNVERFKDLIVYFQVIMTVVVVGGYQILPRLMDFKAVHEIDISGRWWNAVFPPCWFAAPAGLMYGRPSPVIWLAAALGLAVPAIGLIVVVRHLAPGFAELLQRMDTDSATESGGARRERRLRGLLASVITRDGEQRAGFTLSWTMLAHDRSVKQRVYSQVAFALLWPIVLLFIRPGGPALALREFDQPGNYLLPLYFAAFFLPATLYQISYSTSYEAAWIYYAVPLKSPGKLVLGAIQALACRLALPVYLVVGSLVLAVGGWKLLPDVVLAFCMIAVAMSATALLVARDLPYSSSPSTMQSGGRFGAAFVMMLPPVMLGFLHFGLTHVRGGVILAIPPAAALVWVLMRLYTRVGWPKGGLRLAVD